MSGLPEWKHMNAVHRLVAEGRADEAIAVAEQGFADIGGTALACLYAQLLAAADRVDDAVSLLQRAVDDGADLRAVRDLAVLQRDRVGDDDGARETCLRGLADRTYVVADDGSAVDDDGAVDEEEESRLARHELATLYLRLCPREGLDGALEIIGADVLPMVDGLLVRAFALGLESDFDGDVAWAVRMFHEALARDPYHPVGLYDLACTLATSGYASGARSALLDAIRNGHPRLAARSAHDRDLDGIEVPAEDLRRAVGGTSHALLAFQVKPVYDSSWIKFRIRPDMRERAYDYGITLSFSGLVGVLRMRPDFIGSPPDEPQAQEFELYMRADRSYFRGFELHCALRRIAPLVEDTHGFVYDWNVGGYLDEIAVVDRQLTLVRQHTDIGDARTRSDLLKERLRLRPNDHLLAEAVAIETEL